MYYISDQIMEMFDISRETVRNWSTEFAQYLSPTANPAKGQTRQYTQDDLAVFALVAELKKQRWKYADIHPLLQSGQRGDPPIDQHPDLFSGPGMDTTTLKQALSHAIQKLEEANTRIEELETQVTTAQSENTELKTQLAVSQAERNQLNKQVNALLQRMQDMTQQITTHYRQGYRDGLNDSNKDMPEN